MQSFIKIKAYQNIWHKNRYKKFKEEGKCVNCGGTRDNIKFTRCAICREKSKKHTANYRRRKRVLLPPKHKKPWISSGEKLKNIVMEHFGGKCVCCGEAEVTFLAIDHIDGNGAQHRKEIGHTNLYRWIVKNNFPEGFQILCRNCNWGKFVRGICPHQTERGNDISQL